MAIQLLGGNALIKIPERYTADNSKGFKTHYSNTVGTSKTYFELPKASTKFVFQNEGVSDIYVTVGSQPEKELKPSETWTVETTEIRSFGVRSLVNTQEFTVTAYAFVLSNLDDINKHLTKKDKQIDKLLKITAKDKGTMLLDSSNTSDWIKWYGYQVQADTTNVKYASTGIQIIDDSSGTAARNDSIRPFSALKDNKSATLLVYIEDAENVDALEFYFSDVTDYSGYQSFTFVDGTLCDGWNELTIDLSKLVASGTGSIVNKKVSIQIRVQASSGTTAKVTFDSLWVKKPSKPKIIFTFDDGWESQYTQAFPLFLERGFRASVGVISNRVGTTNYVTLDNLKEMYRYGWDLFNHTETHPDLSTLSSDQVINEISKCKNYLLSNGFEGAEDILAYPYGGHNDLVIDALKSRIRCARTLVKRSEAPVPLEPLKVSTHNVLNLAASVITGYIDEAINTGDTLIITAHIIDPVADTTMKYTPTDLETILDHLYTNRDLIEVITISEWVNTFITK